MPCTGGRGIWNKVRRCTASTPAQLIMSTDSHSSTVSL
jgi:hypothetical protein